MRSVPELIALGVYGIENQLSGAAWVPLRGKLVALLGNLSKAPGVPASWLTQVASEVQAGHSIRPVQTKLPSGDLRPGLPAWLVADAALRQVWDEAARRAESVVFLYANDRRVEGLREVDAAIAWSELIGNVYEAAVAIRDLPKNAVSATLDGAGTVVFGVASAVLKSPITWALVLGFVAYKAGWLGKAANVLGRAASRAV